MSILSLSAARAASMAPARPALLAQASAPSSSPYPAEVQEWQRQVQALYQVGNYRKAALIQEKVLAWTEQRRGPDHPDTALSLNNLAFLYANQGAYAKAEPLFRHAVEINEKVLGPDHPFTATSLSNLAGVYAMQGACAKALPLYRRALAINEKALGSNHPTTLAVRENLERCRKALGH